LAAPGEQQGRKALRGLQGQGSWPRARSARLVF
jgi:hypothetical protein